MFHFYGQLVSDVPRENLYNICSTNQGWILLQGPDTILSSLPNKSFYLELFFDWIICMGQTSNFKIFSLINSSINGRTMDASGKIQKILASHHFYKNCSVCDWQSWLGKNRALNWSQIINLYIYSCIFCVCRKNL